MRGWGGSWAWFVELYPSAVWRASRVAPGSTLANGQALRVGFPGHPAPIQLRAKERRWISPTSEKDMMRPTRRLERQSLHDSVRRRDTRAVGEERAVQGRRPEPTGGVRGGYVEDGRGPRTPGCDAHR
jgi:hypothetical protein